MEIDERRLERITSLQWDKRPFPAGMAVNAWRIVDNMDWNSSNGIAFGLAPRLCRSHPFRTASSACRLLSASQIVLLSPSKMNPRISFSKSHFPSSFSNFFSAIGSSSSSSLAGKTS
eukprot:scaffold2729_cov82-Skeletonema_dohrnii-CCMP3373.AAC.3